MGVVEVATSGSEAATAVGAGLDTMGRCKPDTCGKKAPQMKTTIKNQRPKEALLKEWFLAG